MPIYFDHAATTTMVEPAIAALTDAIKKLGNASSLHSAGRSVRKDLEQAREQIAQAIDCAPSEVIFTATGTEANNLAIKGLYWLGVKKNKKVIITSTFEHHAVADPITWLAEHEGAQVVAIDVDRNGFVDLKQLATRVEEHKNNIALISIMHANNEVGTIQDINQVVKIAGDIPVHSDCVQSFGKVELSFKKLGVTAATISAHKIGGPLGVAALILRKGLDIEPVLHGGGQERDLRSGTFNAPGIISFAAAAANAVDNRKERELKIRELKSELIQTIKKNIPDAWVNGDQVKSLPGIVSITFPKTDSEGLLLLLDGEGIACSTGSACSAGVQRPSHVLMAMGLTEDETTSTLRFSLSYSNTINEIAKLGSVIATVVARSKAASGKK
ncbi:MAG: cysteine desulfurase [Actinobacteria bacterium BACL4 MAG-120820-bin23]|nr:MAG: cysteine desulfurase [Actinobacteria bacterium BACL4 MAG-120820-bin23]KRO51094.1 MAG: cysteine desulfurase [Actinobacteria bacterium BACL4 MAG-121001-bin59]HCP72095.1 cysteine desulfurase NifS [Actinomycetota bacterium]